MFARGGKHNHRRDSWRPDVTSETIKKYLSHTAVGAVMLALGLTFGGCIGTGVGWKLGTWQGVVVAPVKPAEPKPVEPKLPLAPIAVDGLTVLIVEESGTRSVEFGDLMADPQWLKWTRENCAKTPDGMPASRSFDKDQNLANAFPVWQQAMAAVKADPKFQEELQRLKDDPDRKFGPNFQEWLLVATPKGGYVGPLPTLEPAKLIEFLKPFVGIKPVSPPMVVPVKPVEKPNPPAEPVLRDCENCGGTGVVRLRLFRSQACQVCEGTGKVK